ncbi:MAG TPA: hypothetical protein VIK24_20140 [Pyrinomonadaceae bacterium]
MSASKIKDSAANADRVQVGNLPQKERELKDQDAENIKGGGGLSGGVIQPPGGEEIPQRNRN